MGTHRIRKEAPVSPPLQVPLHPLPKHCVEPEKSGCQYKINFSRRNASLGVSVLRLHLMVMGRAPFLLPAGFSSLIVSILVPLESILVRSDFPWSGIKPSAAQSPTFWWPVGSRRAPEFSYGSCRLAPTGPLFGIDRQHDRHFFWQTRRQPGRDQIWINRLRRGTNGYLAEPWLRR